MKKVQIYLDTDCSEMELREIMGLLENSLPPNTVHFEWRFTNDGEEVDILWAK